MKNDKTRAMSVFFPFWCIVSHGYTWLIPTVAVTLLLDSAALVALLLLLRPCGVSDRRGTDVGNTWRRKIVPVFLVDISASFASAGLLRLILLLLAYIPGLDPEYLLAVAGTRPASDLFTLLPVIFSIISGGVIIYLANRYIVFGDLRRGRMLAFLLAVCQAPYSLLFPSIFN